MKECFIEPNFTAASRLFLDQAITIIEEYQAQGYDVSVRQVHYQMVSRNIYANTQRNYDRLVDLLTQARLAGLVDWDMIRDRGRPVYSFPTSPSLVDFLTKQADQFKLDLWKDQSRYIEVMVEKQALEGVLYPICEKWQVTLTVNKGYCSVSTMYDRAKYIQSMRDVEHKSPIVFYLGDHDPSGLNMVEDVRSRLELLSDGPVQVVPVALTYDQTQQLNLPENPVKFTDSRAESYVSRFGESSWELDAIDPARLAGMLDRAIRNHVHQATWDIAVDAMERERLRLIDVIEAIKSKEF